MATPAGGGKGQQPFRFAARYAGVCGCCGQDFAVGTQVEYDPDNVLVIVGCEGAQLLDEPDRPPCTKCFLVHAKHQEECA